MSDATSTHPSTPTAPAARNNPFAAKITARQRLTSANGEKETVHVAFDISGSGTTYKCGDALGVYPVNHADKVDALLATLGFSGAELVRAPVPTRATATAPAATTAAPAAATAAPAAPAAPAAAEDIPVRDAFLTKFSLRTISKSLLQLARDRATGTDRDALAAVLDAADPRVLKDWLDAREVADLFEDFPSIRLAPHELAEQLRKLTPRLYSICSSPRAARDSVELTVAVVRYATNGRDREGVCSNYLAHHAPVGESAVNVFVAPSHFAPPEDDAAPLIMVGPGAGVAPFRGFLQDRALKNATGKNWLFFGDRHEASDFLYREELEAWRANGVLTRLSTAWSRDQEAKIYVQDRMLEEGAELWRWLDAGASLHVCGDARRMARDVEAALLEIIEKHGGMSTKEAQNYVRILRHAGRYQRDVY